MACIDILVRPFPRSGGGRVMIWLVRPGAPTFSTNAAAPFAPQNTEGWTDVKKIGDLRFWPDEMA